MTAADITAATLRRALIPVIGVALSIASLCGCGGRTAAGSATAAADSASGAFFCPVDIYTPSHAAHFRITAPAPESRSAMITAVDPWQGGEGESSSLFVRRAGEPVPEGYDGPVVDGDAGRIVVMSTSHVAFLSALGASGRVVGASDARFICDSLLRRRFSTGELVEVGHDRDVRLERIVGASPSVVLLYGLTDRHPAEEQLRRLGIPFLYVADYVEEAPLGKAEWIVALGELIGRRAEASARFGRIAAAYDSVAALAAGLTAGEPVKVMVNAPYNGIWYLPPVSNHSVRLIADAGGALPREIGGSASATLGLEEAYTLAEQCDVWLNPGQARSLADLRALAPKFGGVRPVRGGRVWNATLRAIPGGGNDYWESGVVNPDLVLTDLVKILHPGALPARPFTYYEPLR